MLAKIRELILKGEFLDAYKYVHEISFEELRDCLLGIGLDDKSIASYAFACFLLMENETVEYHILAAQIIMHSFPYIEGSYSAGLYHSRKALALRPDDTLLQADLLFFNRIPEKLIDDEEAKVIATLVIKKMPDDLWAQCVLFGDKVAFERAEEKIKAEKNKNKKAKGAL